MSSYLDPEWVSKANIAKFALKVLREKDLNIQDSNGDTPFMFLARYSTSKSLISAYVKANAQINARNFAGTSPLMAAVRYNNKNADFITEMIKNGADVNGRDSEHGYTPLMYAVLGEAPPPIFKVLLEHGARVEIVEPAAGMSALHFAAAHYHDPIVISLLAISTSSSLLETFDEDGMTPLMRACASNTNLSVVLELLSMHADANVEDGHGQTPLSLISDNEEAKENDPELYGEICVALSEITAASPPRKPGEKAKKKKLDFQKVGGGIVINKDQDKKSKSDGEEADSKDAEAADDNAEVAETDDDTGSIQAEVESGKLQRKDAEAEENTAKKKAKPATGNIPKHMPSKAKKLSGGGLSLTMDGGDSGKKADAEPVKDAEPEPAKVAEPEPAKAAEPEPVEEKEPEAAPPKKPAQPVGGLAGLSMGAASSKKSDDKEPEAKEAKPADDDAGDGKEFATPKFKAPVFKKKK